MTLFRSGENDLPTRRYGYVHRRAERGTVGFASATYSVGEDDGTVTVIIQRTNGSDGPVTANWATADGTATAGLDYVAASGSVSWADGESDDKSVQITMLQNAVYESPESFSVQLTEILGADEGINPTAVTITDAPAGLISFSSSTYSGASGGSIQLTVLRSGGSNGPISVNYSTQDGTAIAGSDYTSASGTLSWADGDVEPKTFNVSTSTISPAFVRVLYDTFTSSSDVDLSDHAPDFPVGGPNWEKTSVSGSRNLFVSGADDRLYANFDSQQVGGSAYTYEPPGFMANGTWELRWRHIDEGNPKIPNQRFSIGGYFPTTDGIVFIENTFASPTVQIYEIGNNIAVYDASPDVSTGTQPLNSVFDYVLTYTPGVSLVMTATYVSGTTTVNPIYKYWDLSAVSGGPTGVKSKIMLQFISVEATFTVTRPAWDNLELGNIVATPLTFGVLLQDATGGGALTDPYSATVTINP